MHEFMTCLVMLFSFVFVHVFNHVSSIAVSKPVPIIGFV